MYDLKVISRHSEFNGKQLKKYDVNGISTIGVYGDEPFEILFTNNFSKKIQVRISIDGIDTLTGELATTSPNGKMWVVQPFRDLSLKAWAETNKGGAQFVFTHENNSVALHTQNNLSSKGIISAAVFTESIEIFSNLENIAYLSSKSKIRKSSYPYDVFCNNQISCSTAAVGVGNYASQLVAEAAGLYLPRLSEIVTLRYMWWDELKLKINNYTSTISDGFPGDKTINMVNLKNTPRLHNNININELSRVW